MSSTVSHKSLWEETARFAPETPLLEGEAHADVVVIGGGFCGLSCALHLAEGAADTVLLESGLVAV
jgi:ribulose 1,5-bisphosphate synthetase/thiazole synthase